MGVRVACVPEGRALGLGRRFEGGITTVKADVTTTVERRKRREEVEAWNRRMVLRKSVATVVLKI